MNRKSRLLSTALTVWVAWASAASAQNAPPYLDSRRSVPERVADLLGRMTLEEKIGQMCQYPSPASTRARQGAGAADPMKEIEPLLVQGSIGSFLMVTAPQEANELQRLAARSRLRIPLILGLDSMHGAALVPGATVFPTQIGRAATFDPPLIRNAAVITARETRAVGVQWIFNPFLGVAREPRWGRTGETFGEDPHLVSVMGMAVVQGFQGTDLASTESVLACLTTFAAFAQPLGGRNLATIDVSDHTLFSVHHPPFEAGVRAGAGSVMAAYNDLNGVPCHASEALLTGLLRKAWGFPGFVVSDWGGVEFLHSLHRVAANQKDAVRQAVLAGVDMHMAGPGFFEPLLELVREGAVPAGRVDEAAGRILEAKFRLGLFENALVDPRRAPATLARPDHVACALEVARKSMVLLRNEGALLPLSRPQSRIVVSGPNADNNALLGDWTAPQPPDKFTTVLEGIRHKAGPGTTVEHVECGRIGEITPESIRRVAEAARGASVAVLVVGEDEMPYDDGGKLDKRRAERTGGEGIDRLDLALPGRQLDLVQVVHATGTPTIVVLINGRPPAIPWIAENVPAILEAWQPGMEGGTAVAEILFGDVVPSGRLPISFPRHVGQLPVYYNHYPSAKRSYIDGPHEPVFSFGHGLSYTRFAYSDLVAPERVALGENVPVSVTLTNTGKRAGEEVVLLFVTDLVSSVTTPVRALRAFTRVALEPGASRTVSFLLTPDDLALVDGQLRRTVEPGRFAVSVGGERREFDVLAR